jgi:low affinity Fe/Cu permease
MKSAEFARADAEGIFEVHNSFVGLEHLTEEELKDIRGRCWARPKGEIAAVTAKGRAEGKRLAAIDYAGTTG